MSSLEILQAKAPGEVSHEEVELKSPFPVIPPLKDSKWNETAPQSPDGQSQPVEPPKLYPDIGEPHPCPYYIGPDHNFINPNRFRKKKPAPPVVPTPVIPPPVIPAPPLPLSPVRSPTPEDDNILTREEENEILDELLQDCLHGVVWEYVADQGRDMTKEMFSAMISRNPKKFILDQATLNILSRKIFKKRHDNWTEPCEPIDSLKFDVLACQAYKLNKARYTVTNEGLSEFHKKTVSQADLFQVIRWMIEGYSSSADQKLLHDEDRMWAGSIMEKASSNLINMYASDMDKKMKKQDPKDLKQQPPRYPSFL